MATSTIAEMPPLRRTELKPILSSDRRNVGRAEMPPLRRTELKPSPVADIAIALAG